MSFDERSTSAGRNMTLDWIVMGTSGSPAARSIAMACSSWSDIATCRETVPLVTLTTPDMGPVDSVSVIFDAPPGATSTVVDAVPLDQNEPISGYDSGSV